MAEEWFEELKRKVDHFFATKTDEEIRAVMREIDNKYREDDNECLMDDDEDKQLLESQPDKRAGAASKAVGTCNGSVERDHDFPP